MTDTPKPVEQWRESVVSDGTKFIVRPTPNWKPGDFPMEDFTFAHLQTLEADAAALREQVADSQRWTAHVEEMNDELLKSSATLRERLEITEKKAALADEIVPDVRRWVENLDYEDAAEDWLARYDSLSSSQG